MATKSPLARVKEEFGGKDKLVDKIVGLLGSGDEPKDEMRRRLLGAANSKLVRLHGVATQVKELGGKDQLASAAAQEMGRGKDKDYVVKLGTFSSGKLVDLLQSARRRNKRKAASTAGKSAAAPSPARAKRAAAAKTAAPKGKAAAKKTAAPASKK
ncbi:MAG: hypothetical protein ABUL77_03615 [Bacteroidota bacterium]